MRDRETTVKHFNFRLVIGLFCLTSICAAPLHARTFTVTNTADAGAGSLRQSMASANASAGSDTINFRIASGVQTIAVTSPLPTLTGTVTIDSTTQPGFSGRPLIVLTGTRAGPPEADVNGLVIRTADCVVKGLVINGFRGAGILIEGAAAKNNRVEGCYFGLNAAGTARVSNTTGVFISGAGSNVIGGVTEAARNVISGGGILPASGNGIVIAGTGPAGTATQNNVVQGNYIGLNAAGTAAIPNVNAGIYVDAGAKNNLIGGASGPNTGAGNVISGNRGAGIFIIGDGTDGNRVQGNFIGLDKNGIAAVPNKAIGLWIARGAKNTVAGGTTTLSGVAPGNVIAGNLGGQVAITDAGTDQNRVEGNLIGLNKTGNAGFTISSHGVYIGGGARNTIGGTTAGVRNVISATDAGVFIENYPPSVLATGNKVLGNYLGTDVSGTKAVGNRLGVLIAFSRNNTIGGPTNELGQMPGNLISGNREFGIRILGSGSSGNTVQGNLIGTDVTGTKPLPNRFVGVGLTDGATANTIGGLAANTRNIISGNGGNGPGGIIISNSRTIDNVIQGNYIGVDKAGTAALPNGFYGGIVMAYGAHTNTIGGVTAGARNLISGNGGDGIVFTSERLAGGINPAGDNDNPHDNKVLGNTIGADVTGTTALGNSSDGVELGGAQNNVIGGTSSSMRNLISGNGDAGVKIRGTTASGNKVLGNFIGVDAGGTVAVGNGMAGVHIEAGARENIIGTRNIISGNDAVGITITGSDTTGNKVLGNFIGTTANGAGVNPNRLAGVTLSDGAHDNAIGGTGSGQSNRIAFNGTDGVALSQGAAGNAIRGNAIFDNGGLGINLAGGSEDGYGVTANEAADGDTGPNSLQNFPSIDKITVSGNTTTIQGTINSTPGTSFAVDFYRNSRPRADPSGYGEGEVYVGSAGEGSARAITTNESGIATFTFTASGNFTGQFFTATAVNLSTGDTSEFSTVPIAITEFSPPGGPPGTQVTITGGDFTGATAVSFNGVRATSFRVQDATRISATVPNGASTGRISVESTLGIATSRNDFIVTNHPLNDDFARAQRLRGSEGSTRGINLQATVESDEPAHAGTSAGQSVWYVWTAPAAGAATVQTTGSSFNTRLAIYTGASLKVLAPVAGNDNAPGVTTSRVEFPAVAGQKYFVAVDGVGNAMGNIVLSWSLAGSAPANDNFNNAQIITGSAGSVRGTNVRATRQAQEPNHAGDPGGASVWYQWTPSSSGRVTFHTRDSSFDAVLAVYTNPFGESANARQSPPTTTEVTAGPPKSLLTRLPDALTTSQLMDSTARKAASF